MKQGYVDEGKPFCWWTQATIFGVLPRSMDNGATIIELTNEAGYDIATLGNHEFDYGMARAKAIIKEADFPMSPATGVTCAPACASCPLARLPQAASHSWASRPPSPSQSPLLLTHERQSRPSTSTTSWAVTTEENCTTPCRRPSTRPRPWRRHHHRSTIWALTRPSSPWTSEEVIANTTGFDALIDGHSHRHGEQTGLRCSWQGCHPTQTGSYLANVGKDDHRRGRRDHHELISTAVSDAAVAATRRSLDNDVDAMLGERIATTDINFTISDPLPASAASVCMRPTSATSWLTASILTSMRSSSRTATSL